MLDDGIHDPVLSQMGYADIYRRQYQRCTWPSMDGNLV
jgi:hypothetical protein